MAVLPECPAIRDQAPDARGFQTDGKPLAVGGRIGSLSGDLVDPVRSGKNIHSSGDEPREAVYSRYFIEGVYLCSIIFDVIIISRISLQAEFFWFEMKNSSREILHVERTIQR
jgi:hypothetical protein